MDENVSFIPSSTECAAHALNRRGGDSRTRVRSDAYFTTLDQVVCLGDVALCSLQGSAPRWFFPSRGVGRPTYIA